MATFSENFRLLSRIKTGVRTTFSMPVYNKRLKQDKLKELTRLLMLHCFHLAAKQTRQQYIDIQGEGLYAELEASFFLTKRKYTYFICPGFKAFCNVCDKMYCRFACSKTSLTAMEIV